MNQAMFDQAKTVLQDATDAGHIVAIGKALEGKTSGQLQEEIKVTLRGNILGMREKLMNAIMPYTTEGMVSEKTLIAGPDSESKK